MCVCVCVCFKEVDFLICDLRGEREREMEFLYLSISFTIVDGEMKDASD